MAGLSAKSTTEPAKASVATAGHNDAKPTSGSSAGVRSSSSKQTASASVSRSLESTFLSIDYIQKEVSAAKGANGLGQKRSRPGVSAAAAAGSGALDRSGSNESAASSSSSSSSSGLARGSRGRALGGSLPLELA